MSKMAHPVNQRRILAVPGFKLLADNFIFIDEIHDLATRFQNSLKYRILRIIGGILGQISNCFLVCHHNFALVRSFHSGKDFQKRTLATAISTNNTNLVAVVNAERNPFEQML